MTGTIQQGSADPLGATAFVKLLIAGRLGSGRGQFEDDTLLELLSKVQLESRGVTGGQADEGERSHSLALSRASADGTIRFYLMANAYWEPLTFNLPPVAPGAAHGWRRWIDTGCPSPEDISSWAAAPAVPGTVYCVGAGSVAALVATIDEPARQPAA